VTGTLLAAAATTTAAWRAAVVTMTVTTMMATTAAARQALLRHLRRGSSSSATTRLAFTTVEGDSTAVMRMAERKVERMVVMVVMTATMTAMMTATITAAALQRVTQAPSTLVMVTVGKILHKMKLKAVAMVRTVKRKSAGLRAERKRSLAAQALTLRLTQTSS
jgi:hypothetical protein